MTLVNAFGNLALDANLVSALNQLTAILAKLNASVAVTGPLTDAQLRASVVPVTGTVVAVTTGLTDTQLRATPVPVSGAVTTGGLTDAQLRASSVPVTTGGLTDAQLRATPVPVSGTVGVSGTVPVSGPLTDTQLRATPVPVSGTVTATGPLTDTQLRATAPAVKDDYQGGEVLADQTGAGAVLTFTFSAAVQLVVVHVVLTSGTARVDPFGGTPTVSQGIRVDDGIPTFIPITTTVVKVFAPSGMAVTVHGFRHS